MIRCEVTIEDHDHNFRPRFRSRDAAIAAATRLTHLVPGHDYEAWPNRGYWVLVMRYRDDDGHIRFKFVGPEDLLSIKRDIQFKKKPGPQRGSKFFRPTTSRQSKNLPPRASSNHTVAIPKNGR